MKIGKDLATRVQISIEIKDLIYQSPQKPQMETQQIFLPFQCKKVENEKEHQIIQTEERDTNQQQQEF